MKEKCGFPARLAGKIFPVSKSCRQSATKVRSSRRRGARYRGAAKRDILGQELVESTDATIWDGGL
jgi:hypothetical protein